MMSKKMLIFQVTIQNGFTVAYYSYVAVLTFHLSTGVRHYTCYFVLHDFIIVNLNYFMVRGIRRSDDLHCRSVDCTESIILCQLKNLNLSF